MELIIISGRSGSGKSTALHQLEDLGYYCVDNLPAALLPQLAGELLGPHYSDFKGIAVCIDARNNSRDLTQVEPMLRGLPESIESKVLFLDASDPILIKRFSETRRKHPLSTQQRSLAEAIAHERVLLEPLAAAADLSIDTTELNLYSLRSTISTRLGEGSTPGLSLLIESFGFKRGVPTDADLLFDCRLLSNPHWVTALRAKTGCDIDVQKFLEGHPETGEFVQQLINFIEYWLPYYARSQRSYFTIAIGCTGGQHRSVYVAEQVFSALQENYPKVQLRHRELTGLNTK
ncbi:RNase adapter RapZ [Flavobacteriaceae bacterium]|nr:RNase adapter RapZ [Flavobacteriaceae bacterium]